MKIGIATGVFYYDDILDVIPLVSEAGYHAIEVWAGPQKSGEYTHFNWHDPAKVRALAVYMEGLDLVLHSVHAPFSNALDLTAPDELRRKAAVDEVAGSMEVTKELGGEVVVVHPASTDASMRDRSRSFAQSRKSIEELAFHAERLGLKLAVENQLPHIFGGDPVTLLALIEGLPPERVGLCFDSSHAHLMRWQPVDQTYRQLAASGRIMTLHISDNAGHYDDHWIMGRGTIDWRRLIQAVKGSGYDGTFMLELQGDPSREKLVHLAEAFRVAERLLAG